MGKYEFKHDIGARYDIGYLIPHLNNIANELAEANRLKRLELNELYNKSDYIRGELEDQA